jgi:trimethylamine--corrinoid protein Co-methyltransferase
MPRRGVLVQAPYRRMTDLQVEQVHHASMELLTDPGVLCFNREAADIFQAGGAEVAPVPGSDSGCWLLKIPEALVLNGVDSAPKTVKLGARNEDNSLIMAGDEPRVYLVSGSETNFWLETAFETYVKKSDPGTERQVPEFEVRRGTVADLCRAARLCEQLDTLDAFIRCVNIQDRDVTEENKDVNKYFASLNNTTKHVMAGLTTLGQLDNLVRMAEIIAGGKEQLRENPIISFITCLVKSPLQFVDDTTQTMIELCRRGLPTVVSCAPQGGTTAPIREDGIVVQINAEILAGIALSQLVNPGAPVLYGAVPVRARMDNLHDSYGAPESSQYNIDCIQMARFYKIPCYSTSGVSDPKAPGLQASIERMLSNAVTMMSGPQYLHCAFGLLEKNLTFSPLQAVLDDAHFQMIKFFLRPPRLSEAELAESLSQIRQVMGTPQKLYIHHIRRLLRSGQLSPPYPFESEGLEDNVLALASQRMEELLSRPVEHIDEATTKRIFQEIPGILPRLNSYREGGEDGV